MRPSTPAVFALLVFTLAACQRSALPRIAPSCTAPSVLDQGLLAYAVKDGAGFDPLQAYAHEIRDVSLRARTFDSDAASFARVTPEVRFSQVPPKDDDGAPIRIALWANTDAARGYETLDSEHRDSPPVGDEPAWVNGFPQGTVLVREVRSEDDEPALHETAKIMAKMPKGYAPAMNDWWFGERDQVDHQVRAASPCVCMGCHSLHADSDLVVGPPARDSAPPGPGGAYGG